MTPLKAVTPALDRIAKSLESAQDARELLLTGTREVIVLCSKSIIAVHKGDLEAGRGHLKAADRLLRKYRTKASSNDLGRYLVAPEQEYVEAACLAAVAQRRQIPSDRDLRIMMPEAYVLGLLDCVGELKRMAYDRLRLGDIAESSRIFGIMEDLYLRLYPFSMYDKVVKEARRKIDVNRALVESVRSVVTEEARRAELIKAMRELSDRL